MHFEILVEDSSGKELLDIIVPKIIDTSIHTYNIKGYKGCGRIPKDLKTTQDPQKRILLEQLPRLLRGYGKTYVSYNAVVIIVIDCDSKTCTDFKSELVNVLENCDPKPRTFFRIAIEEMEAWLLGDKAAIQTAYPKLNNEEYSKYKQDSIIGTWEKLADITLPNDSAKHIKKANFIIVGNKKSEWARNIGSHMDIQNNASPSFNCFKNKLEELAKEQS